MRGGWGRSWRARRAVAVVVLLVAGQLAALAWPAHACGCGGMVVDERQQLNVEQETSVVRWDGRRQDIVMSLTVDGDATEAAWIMPVPGRAEVELGDEQLFTDLRDATRPEQRVRSYFWPRPGDWPRPAANDGVGDAVGDPGVGDAAPPPVDVIDRGRLGPFDVAQLAATDAGALEGWLADHGFTLPDDLAGALEPYVAQEWEYVAVRLAPAAEDDAPATRAEGPGDAEGGDDGAEVVLGGTLDPIHLSFATDEPVYPMRLSSLADVPQSLRLYVLAPHRMEPAGSIGGERPRVGYAARLTPDEQPAGPVRRLAGGETFLTVIEQEFPRPERIDGDHLLRRAAADAEYVPVVYEDRLLTWLGVPAWLLTVLLALLVTGLGGGWLARRAARRRRYAALLGVHRP